MRSKAYKYFAISCLLFFICSCDEGKQEEVIDTDSTKSVNVSGIELLREHDLSDVITRDYKPGIRLGYIGLEFQRFQIEFLSVIKNHNNPEEYLVYGKDIVHDNICEFQGTIRFNNVKALDSSEILQRFIASGEYHFNEDPDQKHVGYFEGEFESRFYLDSNNIPVYDDLDINKTDFSNNRFTGRWIKYGMEEIRICNWGDYRIPNSKNLDIGAGSFKPAEKFLDNGWINYLIEKNLFEESSSINEWWKR